MADQLELGPQAEVAIAVERRHPTGLGRMRMRRIGEDRKRDIFDFASDSIAPGTLLATDGGNLYHDLGDELDIIHEPIVLVAADDPAHILLPAVHRVASLLK